MILKMINIRKMNQIKYFINFLEIFYKSFSNIFNILWAFLLHLKDHGIFILMADEKMNRGVHPPQKIMKKKNKKSENIYTIGRIFFIFRIFLLACTPIFIF